ncbi:MAG: YmdB family metallophosphoesterase [Bacilli bacterium]|nr:YmdB family metallophosphoesterase [Bacilli bacterium]
MRILFFGDIVGNPGILAVSDVLPSLLKRFEPDFVIANGENATRGFGINYRDALRLRECGIDAVTLGNHWRNRSSIDDFIEELDWLIRPCNVRNYDFGQGYATFDVDGVALTVVNVLGTAFMKEEVNSPIVSVQDVLNDVSEGIVIVDYHGESTSEKATFAYYFDGQVSAVLGTHTHVQTNDARVLPQGTAFISDVGMCGPYESVIGFEPQSVIRRLFYGDAPRMEISEEGKRCVNAIVLDVDPETYLATSIQTLYLIDGKERQDA